jgi:hypothetical protein
MGMFDTIEVSDALPTNAEMDELGLNKRDWTLQTKDFDCALDVYVLQDGQLYLKKYRVEQWVPGDPNGRSITEKIGYLNRAEMYLDPVKVTREIHMYDYRQNVQEKWDAWSEWTATFIDGKVSKIELFEFRGADNAARKAHEKAYWDRVMAEDSKWYNRYFLRTAPYRWVAYKIRNGLYRTAEYLQYFAQFL